MESSISEEERIQRIVSGKPEEFRWIVQKYNEKVATICYGMLQDHEEAVEMGQTIFIKLFEALPTFKFNSTLETYLTRIAINQCLNRSKQRQKEWKQQVETTELDFIANGSDAYKELENRELTQLALQYLEPKQRSMVVLRMMEGYSIKETAIILDVAEGTVMSGVSRGLQKMKNYLKKLGHG
ncbi:MAG: RNA polymerase sigma-70 factor (ECF subfamily) [Bacteroidia bacterium]